MEKIKVLHIMAGADAGGISSVVVNYYSHIDRDKIHFDVALTTDVDGINGRVLRGLGANVYRIALKSIDRKAYVNDIKSLLIKNKYDAIHVHESSTSWVALKAAKEVGVKIRIAHAHTAGSINSNLKYRIKQWLGYWLNPYYATHLVSCGEKAGIYCFGRRNSKAITIIPNAIDTQLYSYDENIRNQVREELRVKNKFVVGMVGRVSPQKNNIQAISIFNEVQKEIPNAVLVMAGDGEDMEKAKAEIGRLDLGGKTLCLGNRSDINRLLQAYDVFILPSLYEGFPVAAVEAMATGLPVLLSETITSELSFGSAVRYLSLDNNYAWVCAAKEFVGDDGRKDRQYELKNNGLDIRNTALILENIYLKQSND